MKTYKGFVKMDTSDKQEFTFEVPGNATEGEIEEAAQQALWESGIIDWWWEEA